MAKAISHVVHPEGVIDAYPLKCVVFSLYCGTGLPHIQIHLSDSGLEVSCGKLMWRRTVCLKNGWEVRTIDEPGLHGEIKLRRNPDVAMTVDVEYYALSDRPLFDAFMR